MRGAGDPGGGERENVTPERDIGVVTTADQPANVSIMARGLFSTF